MKRTIAPLTYEDLGHFNSLSLISTLREADRSKPSANFHAPPSFFDEDETKWHKKFAPAIADRAGVKKNL